MTYIEWKFALDFLFPKANEFENKNGIMILILNPSHCRLYQENAENLKSKTVHFGNKNPQPNKQKQKNFLK